MSFLSDIETVLGDEAVEAWVCGPGPYSCKDGRFEQCPHDMLLEWDAHKHALDYEYASGSYGGPHCNPVWIWTATRLIFVREYDGSTDMGYTPRHPEVGSPWLV